VEYFAEFPAGGGGKQRVNMVWHYHPGLQAIPRAIEEQQGNF